MISGGAATNPLITPGKKKKGEEGVRESLQSVRNCSESSHFTTRRTKEKVEIFGG